MTIRLRNIIGIIIVFCVLAINSYFYLPLKQKVSVGDPIKVDLSFPEKILENFVVHLEGEKGLTDKEKFGLKDDDWPIAKAPGTINMYLKLFGIIPVKEMIVDVVPAKKVLPSGHSIGVVVKSKGITVLGYSTVIDNKNKEYNPAKEAGILVGDIILEANSQKVTSNKKLNTIINHSGEKGKNVKLKVKREGKTLNINIKPIKCSETNSYRIGLYVQDTTTGVGTMTYIDPETNKYGALGHVIANSELSENSENIIGRIVEATIQGIQESKKGRPGEKIGIFMNKNKLSGNINKNTRFGVYGTLDNIPNNLYFKEPIPVAYLNQIKEGPAEMLTVINDDKIEKFSIEIQKIIPYQKINGKGLIIKITDQKLLDTTGGIIQGMSGSPIIQDGKLVGAVTHVFVNDPTRGYGILAEWMLEESNLKTDSKSASFIINNFKTAA